MATIEEIIDYVHSLYPKAGIDGAEGFGCIIPIDSIRSMSRRDNPQRAVQRNLDELQGIYETSEWFSVRYEAAHPLIPSRLSRSQLEEDISSWIQAMRRDVNDIHLNADDRSDYVADACMLARLSKNAGALSFVKELMQSEYTEVRDTCQLYLCREKPNPCPEPNTVTEIVKVMQPSLSQSSFWQNHPCITAAAIGAAAVGGAAAILYFGILYARAAAISSMMHGPL